MNDTPRSHGPNAFYARWILANAWSEGAGLGAALLFAGWAARALERNAPGVATVLAGAALGPVLAMALVRVLRRHTLRVLPYDDPAARHAAH